MTRSLQFYAVVLLAATWFFSPNMVENTRAEEPPGKLILETWDNALLEGNKAGYVHFTVREVGEGEAKKLVATRELRLTLRRGADLAQISADIGTEENPSGEVRKVLMRQGLGQRQNLKLTGIVNEGKVRLKVEGTVSNEKEMPWPEGVLGLVGEMNLLKDKKPKPGDKLSYLYFEPTVNTVVKIQVEIGEPQEVTLPSGQTRTLLPAKSTPEKIGDVQLPGSTQWVDPKTYEPVMVEGELPGLGSLTLVRTTKEVALAPFTPRVQVFNQSVVLKQRLLNIHDLKDVTYRVTLPEDENPKDALPTDVRQRVKPTEDGSLEVTVQAVRKPEQPPDSKGIDKEFTQSNFFINSDDQRVAKLAAQAVGNETDPWKKAQRIERWVHQNMKSLNFSEAMATADHVAKTLSGDCTEFAMLTAAMCRAAGVPSRTAIGLIYVDSETRPLMAFHMWTEVYVDGQWLALDATLGRGSVGPGHLKITDHSWHDTRSFTPLLPVMRILVSKPSIEILRATREN